MSREAGLKTLARSVEVALAMAIILVVDDEPMATEVVSAVLSRAGHTVHTHDSGFGLAMAIHRLQPDLVLLDVDMPGLSGPKSLGAAADLDAAFRLHTRILLHSGMDPVTLASLAQITGAHGYVSKPSRPAALTEAVARCLDQPKRRLGAS